MPKFDDINSKRRIRNLVEGIYEDAGCPIHPKCLECPLPVCVYDMGAKQGTIGGYNFRATIYPIVKQATDANELAKLIDRDTREAFRILAQYRKAKGDFVRFVLGITPTKKYRLKHREEIEARRKKHRLEHQEETRASYKKYYLAHKKEKAARGKKYRLEHQEEISARRKEQYRMSGK